MKLKKLLALVVSLVALTVIGVTARPVAAQTSGSEFTISPVFSDQQSSETDDYFSYLAQPAAVLPVAVNLQNLSSDQAHQFEIRLVTATTTDQGKINYHPTKKQRDATATTTLPELVQDGATIKQVTLQPGAVEKISFDLTVPKNGLKGTVLGSIFVRRIDQEKNEDSIGILNEFSMLVPVLLKSATNPVKKPELQLEAISLDSSGGAAYLKTPVHNLAPVMFGKIKIVAQVTKKGQTKVLLTQTDQNYEMAPNSTMDYHVATGGQTLAPGKYTMQVKLTSGAQTFQLTKDFTIKAGQRQTVEKTLQTDNRTQSRLWLWLIIGGLLLVIAVLLILLLRKRTKKQRD